MVGAPGRRSGVALAAEEAALPRALPRPRGPWRQAGVLLLLAPALLFLVLFLALPLARIAMLSLNPNILLKEASTGPTIGNYLYFLSTSFYAEALLRTFRIALLATVSALAVGYPTAYVLRSATERLGGALVLALSFPILAGGLILTMGWIILLSDQGIVNSVLRALLSLREGVPIPLLHQESGVVVALAHFISPFVTLNLYNGLKRVEPELEEASMGLGASRLRTFWHVVGPLSLPGVLSGTLLGFSMAASAYVTPYFIGGPTKLVVTTLISQLMLSTFNWEMASTCAVILVVLALAIVFVYNRAISRFIAQWAGAS